MKVDILNIEGKSTGRSAELPENIFGITPNEHSIYLAIKAYHANQRQGTHKSKERAEIAGSTRKLKRQKGTGTARAGSIKSPVFRGGGRVFGPRPRSYEIRLNKKIKRLARYSALSQKCLTGSVTVVEDISFDAPKTSTLTGIFKNLGVSTDKNMLVIGKHDNNVYLSGRNIAKTNVVTADCLNTYEILNCKNLILTESSIKAIAEQLNKD